MKSFPSAGPFPAALGRLVLALALGLSTLSAAAQRSTPADHPGKVEAPDKEEAAAAAAAANAAAPSASGPSAVQAASAQEASAQEAGDPHAGMPMRPHRPASLLPEPGPVPPAGLADVSALSGVAVLHEGRLKPMETFARHILLQFSGRTSYKEMDALQVISRILFAPELTGDYKIFLINNPEVAEALGIAPEKRRKYSFRQLEKSLGKLQEQAEKADAVEAEKRDLFQKEVLRAFGNVVEYLNLTRTLSWALPAPSFAVTLPETRAALKLPEDRNPFAFWDLMERASAIAKVLEGVGDRGQDQRTSLEGEVIALSQAMYLSSQTLAASPLKSLPSSAASSGWFSPPEAVAVPEQLQAFHTELGGWAAAAAGWRKGDQAAFDAGMKAIQSAVENRAFEQIANTHFPLEIAYQKGQPFYWALVLFWLSLLGTFAYFLWRKPWLYLGSTWIFLAGFAILAAGIVARILIMKRPPVTSLYETFPFVASVALLAAFLVERIYRKKGSAGIGLLSASLLGVILLSIANRYAAEGDTMRMLVAVLDSNFWLSTHVITVTIGYSACLLAGAIGHVYMARALLPGDASKPERLKDISKMIYGTLCFGLLFSFIGTVLGGIWADQSWGRFWGWDPKENGALLIVIWCVILLHAKHWGYIRNPGMALGSIFGAIVVALAWFGVNLLNVGLHSYGFTDGAATKLFAYCGVELLFMAVTGTWLRWGPKPSGKPATAGRAPAKAAAAEAG